MPRINIEESYWTDPRRGKLIRMLKGDAECADGAVVAAWRVAQEYWKDGRLIPYRVFSAFYHATPLIDAGLARLHIEDDPTSPIVGVDVEPNATERLSNALERCFVFVEGTSKHHDWVREKSEKAAEAGRKSAEARRAKHGSAQPQRRTPAEQAFGDDRTDSNDAEPSSSISDSISDSELDNYIFVGSLKFENPVVRELVDCCDRIHQVKEKIQVSWLKRYGDVEWLRSELAHADQWLTENPKRQKKDLAKFFGNWLRNGWKTRQAGRQFNSGKGGAAQARVDRAADQFERVEKGEL